MKSGLIRCLSVRFVVIACGLSAIGLFTSGAARSDENSGTEQRWSFEAIEKVPEKARTQVNPLSGDSQAVVAGRKLYGQHCAECHGAAGEGGTKAPSLRAEEVRSATPGTLFWILTNGVVRRGMPVWSKLPEPERWQIVSFLKSLPPATNGIAVKTHPVEHHFR